MDHVDWHFWRARIQYIVRSIGAAEKFGNIHFGIAVKEQEDSVRLHPNRFDQGIVRRQSIFLYLNQIQPVYCFCLVFWFCINRILFYLAGFQDHWINLLAEKTDEIALLWLHGVE